MRILGTLALTLALAALGGPPLVASTDPGIGGAPAALTLSRAVEMALAQEPGVQAARARRAAAEADLAVAEAGRRLTLFATVDATRYEEPMVITPIHGFAPGLTPEFDDTLIRAGLNARYEIYEGGAREARIERGRSLAAAAAAGLGGRELALVLETASSYQGVWGLAQVLTAHRARLTALAAERNRVDQLLAVGRAAEVDLLRIEAAAAAAEAEQVRLASALDVAERRLARLVGLEPEAIRAERLFEVRLTSDPLLLRERLAQQALAANSEVTRARADLAAAEAVVELTRSARRPRLRLEGGWLDFGSSAGDFTSEWQVGVGLGLPLFDGGATGQRIAAAEAARTAAAEEVRLAEQRVEDGLDRALARATETRALVASLATAVSQFAEVSRIESLRLDQGVGTQTDFLDAEAELLAARAALVQARLGTVAARLEIALVTGELGTDWLATHLEESR